MLGKVMLANPFAEFLLFLLEFKLIFIFLSVQMTEIALKVVLLSC